MTVSPDTLLSVSTMTNHTGWEGLDEVSDKLLTDYPAGQLLTLHAFTEMPFFTISKMKGNWYRDPKTGVAFSMDEDGDLFTTGKKICSHIGIWEGNWYHVYPKSDAAYGEIHVIRLTRTR